MFDNYRMLTLLLSKWPLNTSRGTRDFGCHLRHLARSGFPTGNIFPGDNVENKKKLESLLRITENRYQKQYPCMKVVGASGYSLQEIQNFLKDDSVDRYFERNN